MNWTQAGGMAAVLLGLTMSGCFPQSRNPVLVSNVSSFYLGETENQAKEAGVDYKPTLDKALDKDPGALHALFVLTSSGVLKGRGADSHAAMLWTLLTQWGDRRFSQLLARETARTRQQVILFLDYAAPSAYSKTYPFTYRAGPHSSKIDLQ